MNAGSRAANRRVAYTVLMLGAFLARLPIMVVFLIVQKPFVPGLLGGVVRG